MSNLALMWDVESHAIDFENRKIWTCMWGP